MADNEEQADSPMVTLSSSDGDKFQVSRRAACVSELIQSTLSCGEDDEEDSNVTADIPLPRVRGQVLKYVVEFMIHHEKEPMPEITVPIEGTSVGEVLRSDWYEKFITSMGRETVFEIVSAANFMEIKPLIDLTCLFCSFELAGKSAEEIREIMNFPAMTAEEEAEARENHPWVFEN